ncbi:MAG: dihydroneopterin aldolase [Halioglobus sp.]|nr:dihydroneopterin aldolase [Halioglobus sp.]
MDCVYLRGLRVEAVIGIHDWERDIRQTLVLDLEMRSDTARAARTDAVTDAVDYAAVSARVIEFVSASEYQLIETLAEQVAALLRAEFGVSWLRLRVAKPGAVPEAEDVGVIIERGERA